MDLTTNGVVITDAIKFVQNSREKLATSSKEQENGKDTESEQQQGEKETGELNEQKTTNQIF
jgi:hypothetical protein